MSQFTIRDIRGISYKFLSDNICVCAISDISLVLIVFGQFILTNQAKGFANVGKINVYSNHMLIDDLNIILIKEA